MYTLDKKERITLRLNEKQFAYVKTSADFLGVSPSEYLRMLVNMVMSTDDLIKEKAQDENAPPTPPTITQSLKEDLRRENEKPDIND